MASPFLGSPWELEELSPSFLDQLAAEPSSFEYADISAPSFSTQVRCTPCRKHQSWSAPTCSRPGPCSGSDRHSALTCIYTRPSTAVYGKRLEAAHCVSVKPRLPPSKPPLEFIALLKLNLRACSRAGRHPDTARTASDPADPDLNSSVTEDRSATCGRGRLPVDWRTWQQCRSAAGRQSGPRGRERGPPVSAAARAAGAERRCCPPCAARANGK